MESRCPSLRPSSGRQSGCQWAARPAQQLQPHPQQHCASSSHQGARCAHCHGVVHRRAGAAEGPTPRRAVVASALFSPPSFQPDKLTVSYLARDGSCSPQEASPARSPTQGSAPPQRLQRRYTLTHNDLTGALKLTIGEQFNQAQISGFYTRLLRDEVVAEWRTCSASGRPSLHVYCHVSGEERWLAPPQLRDYIFRRELPLVLDTFLYADRELLQRRPELAGAEVFVHFQSCKQELDTVERWGILGQRSSWRAMPQGLLQRLLEPVFGTYSPQQQAEQQPQSAWQPADRPQPWAAGPAAPWPLPPASSGTNGNGEGWGAPVMAAPCACTTSEEQPPLLPLTPQAAGAACQCGSVQGFAAASDQQGGTLPPLTGVPAGTAVATVEQQQAAAVPHRRRPRRLPQQQQQASEAQQQGDLAEWGPRHQVYVQGADDEQLARSAASTSPLPTGGGSGAGSQARPASQQQQPVPVGPRGAAHELVAASAPASAEPAGGAQVVLDRLAAVAVPVPVVPLSGAAAAAVVAGRLVTPLSR